MSRKMFLVDDLLLAPGKAAYALFNELARKAQEEWLNDDTIKQELQQLYEMLETGRLSEKDFEARECRLLERLEQIARIKFQDKWGAAEPEAPTIDITPTPPPPLALPAPPAPPAPSAPALSAPPAPSALPAPPTPAAPRAPALSAPPAPPAPSALPAAADGPLSMNQIVECAMRAVAPLKMRVSAVISVVPADNAWNVSLELVERRGIPDSNDILGVYELKLDAAGHVIRYERTQMRRRCDFAR